jgi:hypothetical protein
METHVSEIGVLTRREIEARIAGPLIRAFIEEIGRDKALAVVSRVIKSLARESGAHLAKQLGGNSIADLVRGTNAWRAGDALKKEVLEVSETTYYYDMVRCRYADMYRELGMADLGFVLSCERDFEFFRGFNSRMNLVRTKTIMEGYDRCDFRITLE